MEYMEIVTALLVVAMFIVLYFKQPTMMHTMVLKSVINDIEKNQYKMAKNLYNRLPSHIKVKVTEDELVTILSYVMNVMLEVLKEHVKQDKSVKK